MRDPTEKELRSQQALPRHRRFLVLLGEVRQDPPRLGLALEEVSDAERDHAVAGPGELGAQRTVASVWIALSR